MSDVRTMEHEQLLDQLGGDRELLAEVAQIFLDDLESMRRDVRDAVAARDAHAVQRSAHRLKGSLLTLTAEPSGIKAHALEQAGRASDLARSDALLDELERELDRLVPDVRGLIDA